MVSELTDQTNKNTELTAHSLEAALADAIARELVARQTGAWEMQAGWMDEIRRLRLLLADDHRRR